MIDDVVPSHLKTNKDALQSSSELDLIPALHSLQQQCVVMSLVFDR